MFEWRIFVSVLAAFALAATFAVLLLPWGTISRRFVCIGVGLGTGLRAFWKSMFLAVTLAAFVVTFGVLRAYDAASTDATSNVVLLACVQIFVGGFAGTFGVLPSPRRALCNFLPFVRATIRAIFNAC